MHTPFALSQVRVCPYCRSYDVHSSTRQPFMDDFMVLALMKPYRCMECTKRHYNVLWAKREEPPATPKVPQRAA